MFGLNFGVKTKFEICKTVRRLRIIVLTDGQTDGSTGSRAQSMPAGVHHSSDNC